MQPEQRIIIEQVTDPVWFKFLMGVAGGTIAGVLVFLTKRFINKRESK